MRRTIWVALVGLLACRPGTNFIDVPDNVRHVALLKRDSTGVYQFGTPLYEVDDAPVWAISDPVDWVVVGFSDLQPERYTQTSWSTEPLEIWQGCTATEQARLTAPNWAQQLDGPSLDTQDIPQFTAAWMTEECLQSSPTGIECGLCPCNLQWTTPSIGVSESGSFGTSFRDALWASPNVLWGLEGIPGPNRRAGRLFRIERLNDPFPRVQPVSQDVIEAGTSIASDGQDIYVGGTDGTVMRLSKTAEFLDRIVIEPGGGWVFVEGNEDFGVLAHAEGGPVYELDPASTTPILRSDWPSEVLHIAVSPTALEAAFVTRSEVVRLSFLGQEALPLPDSGFFIEDWTAALANGEVWLALFGGSVFRCGLTCEHELNLDQATAFSIGALANNVVIGTRNRTRSSYGFTVERNTEICSIDAPQIPQLNAWAAHPNGRRITGIGSISDFGATTIVDIEFLDGP